MKAKSARFMLLLEENKGILLKVARSYADSKEDRQDLMQEITFQWWQSFEKVNGDIKVSTWLYRIALNVAISCFRKERSMKRWKQEELFKVEEAVSPDSETDERVELLISFISTLPPFDKAIMILYLEQKSYKEIAEITGISLTNVSTRISRIKLSLKRKFEMQDGRKIK